MVDSKYSVVVLSRQVDAGRRSGAAWRASTRHPNLESTI